MNEYDDEDGLSFHECRGVDLVMFRRPSRLLTAEDHTSSKISSYQHIHDGETEPSTEEQRKSSPGAAMSDSPRIPSHVPALVPSYE